MDDIESIYENDCLDFGLMEQLANLVLNKLTSWANQEIYGPLGGELTTSTPLKESVNAGAVVNRLSPQNPSIVIHFGMIQEIYRDALVFPIYSEKIAESTENFKNKNWEMFKGARFKFETGVPTLTPKEISPISAIFSTPWVEEYKKRAHENPELMSEERLDVIIKTLPARFLMFELMLSWVFFHELSDLIQCHYKLKGDTSENIEYYEVVGGFTQPDFSGQSREILADVEGLDLTVRYMEREGFYGPNSMYLLLCSMTCMFNRFCGNGYLDKFHEVKGVHPHPVIRDDFIHEYFCSLMAKTTPFVWEPSVRESILLGYGYLTIRSAMAAGLFWANRYQNFDGKGYPSYMSLQMSMKTKEAEAYQTELRCITHAQLKVITDEHLYSETTTKMLFKNGFFGK
ncbi:hypothetical protein LQN35_004784 [Vibrio parahaemolyticus]|nr:hypothetical protein [Vibrio parahaemolyticus]MDF4490260.1 hypothetical protein [Vibrio parahaemolyticus]MDG3384830.1 hypothetical protein [Vibrio parahaemolyticus]